MARVRVTALVAPYVDDITARKQAGYTWSNIVDMLSAAGVISKDTALMTLRNASINNSYAQYVEQRQIPVPVIPSPVMQVPAPRPLPVNVQETGRREGYGLDVAKIKEGSGSSNSMKDELAKMGLVFS
jgi:hypothetical protein